MDYGRELGVAIDAARAAGVLLLADFHRAGGPRGRGSHADADDEAEKLIRAALLGATTWSFRGEETGTVQGADRRHTWLVDPNDGTSSYLKGARGSAVSIAALRDGVPVIGVVFAFAAPDDEGDLIAWGAGCGAITRNGIPVPTMLAGGELGPDGVVLVSQDGDRNSAANAACVAPARFRTMPSIAYRLALASVGEAVAAVSLNGPCDWDYGAGHALVLAAGGLLLDSRGEPVLYTRDGRSSCGGRCFGGAPQAAAALVGRPWGNVQVRAPKPGGPFSRARLEPGVAIDDPEALRRAQGCLLGLVAGDSLGSLVEFENAASIRARYPDGLRDLAEGGIWKTIAGQPTDDSELALMLARSVVKAGGFDQTAALEAYVHWYGSHPFDRGTTTSAALAPAAKAASLGERRERAAASADATSQSNGSLMRIAPLGILGWRDPSGAASAAREDSGLTHPNEVCREACAAYVAAIATAIGTKGDAHGAYEAALFEARRGGQEAVVEALTAAAEAPPARYDGRDQGWVLIALQNAFYRLLHAPSVEEAVVATVSQGGDTDTTAAICGALLGAVHGREALPPRWRHAVLSCRPQAVTGAVRPRPAEFWPVDVMELAERLLLAGQASGRATAVETA